MGQRAKVLFGVMAIAMALSIGIAIGVTRTPSQAAASSGSAAEIRLLRDINTKLSRVDRKAGFLRPICNNLRTLGGTWGCDLF